MTKVEFIRLTNESLVSAMESLGIKMPVDALITKIVPTNEPFHGFDLYFHSDGCLEIAEGANAARFLSREE